MNCFFHTSISYRNISSFLVLVVILINCYVHFLDSRITSIISFREMFYANQLHQMESDGQEISAQ